MGDEASNLTGSYYAAISQHFLPPPVKILYLVTFTHSSSQYSSRDGEPLQGV